MRNRNTPQQLDLTAIALRSARDQVRTLETLLALEHQRSADLLEKLLITVAAGGSTGPLFGPSQTSQLSGGADWNWPDLQPEDEAVEDVRGKLADGSLSEIEANAILEALGYPDAQVNPS